MPDSPPQSAPAPVRLGLRANLPQFTLLVVINALVGGMLGVPRTVVPLLGRDVFNLESAAAVLGFIAAFGLTKAGANLFAGPLSDRFGRRRILIAGWVLGFPVPILIMWAPSWAWVVAASALLGLNQGLAWSMTVNMKVDLVGPRRRGLALGLNEFAGYAAVGITAWSAGLMAARWGLRPAPLWLAIGYAAAGLGLSALAARETTGHVRAEAVGTVDAGPTLRRVLLVEWWRRRDLLACCQAGLVNNLNDGVMWGILPLLLAARGLRVAEIGTIAGLYPLVWGVGQLGTGWLSDRVGRRGLIAWGMWVQAAGHGVIGAGGAWPRASGAAGAVLLGLGTAMVYPVLLAAVGDITGPAWRAKGLSVYRFWRDLGFVMGAMLAGVLADRLGLAWAVHGAGAATAVSGAVVWMLMGAQRESVDFGIRTSE